MDEPIGIEIADVDRGIVLVLDRLGLSLAELQAQAELDEFQSAQARLTWFLMSPFVKRPA